MGGPDLGLTENGNAQARALAHQVAGERVAAVLGSTMGRAAQTAQIVGEELGTGAEELDGVQEFFIGDLVGSQDQAAVDARSEEHTSELQSRGHLVCRLLLEKKKGHPSSQRAATDSR